jgi:hypothetical protein
MKIAAHVLVVISVVLPVPTSIPAQEYVRESVPKLFSYDELVQLSSDQEMSPDPAEKLKTITATPFINKEAYLSGARAKPLDIPGLGPTLRVAFWNIERGLELDYIELFLTDKNAFMEKVKHEREEAKQNKKAVRSVNLEKIPEQIEILKSADVWILNEVDGGVKRTQYREVIRELGRALNMNWAYGVEFLEIAPAQLGTDTFDDGESNEPRQQLLDEFKVDKGIQWTTGVGIVYSGTKAALKLTGIQYRIDPTSANIPGASPNLERGFFTALEKFRFSNGKAIDFRGVPERTINGKAGTLADSKQRQGPGFAPTFAAELIWGNVKLAKFKLDWFFVKADIDSPRDPKGSYLFAPHFPHTLVDLNNGPAEPIADHSPMTVDLPFQEPNLAPNQRSLQ